MLWDVVLLAVYDLVSGEVLVQRAAEHCCHVIVDRAAKFLGLCFDARQVQVLGEGCSPLVGQWLMSLQSVHIFLLIEANFEHSKNDEDWLENEEEQTSER